MINDIYYQPDDEFEQAWKESTRKSGLIFDYRNCQWCLFE